MSLLAKFESLNQADLSKLSERLAALRAEMERELTLKGENPHRAIAATDLQAASAETGLSVESLLDALETAQRVT